MKNKKVYGLVGVAALAAVGGTFAYYSATQGFNNPFDTTSYSTSAVERFNPNGDNRDWKPGSKVDKQVYVTNTGKGDVWVRVRFDEKWARGNDTLTFGSHQGEEVFNPLKKESDKDPQTSATDGEMTNDKKSVVEKIFSDYVEWSLPDTPLTAPAEKWYYNAADGYFYYAAPLAGKTETKDGETAKLLLDSVKLYSGTDMGLYYTPVYYTYAKDRAKVGTTPVATPAFDEEDFLKNVKVTGEGENKVVTYPDNVTIKNKGEEILSDWILLPDGKGPDKNLAILKPASDKDTKDVFTYQGKILTDKKGYADANYELDIKVEFLQTTEDASIIAEWDKEVDGVKGKGTETLGKLGLYTTPAPAVTP